MKKNTASQIIGAQLVSASDGSAFTGSVTAYVTGDGGTQAAGSVGSGACTHEGNGFHTYTPAQAETNYDHIGFTFTGSGAVPVTIQVYTTFPQTGDSYARLGAPAGASVSADIAIIDGVVDDILTDTGTTIPGTISTAQADLDTLTGSDGVTLATSQPNYAPATTTALATAQADLDTITGADGVTLATSQANYAPSKAGDEMDLVDAPNSTAITAIQSGLATSSALSTVDSNVDSILEDTGTTLPATLSTIDTVVDGIQTDLDNGTDGLGALKALIDALNDVSTADINAQMLDVLNTDTFAEPTGVPAATATLADKIGTLYMALRNRVDVTATKKTFYDDSDNPEWEKDLSDNGTTYSESEGNSV